MKQKICFYILLVLSFLCLFCAWIVFENKNFINVIVETKIENNDDILLKIDNEYLGFKQFNNVLNQTIRKNIDNAELLINQKHKNIIKNIIIFNDIKMYYYPDFSEFEKSNEKLCLNKNCKIYNKYKLKEETLRPHKNKLYSFLNSLSYLDKIFYPFFIFVFLTIFYGYKLKLNKFILPSAILLLTIVLRLSDINTYLPWGDECYSIELSLVVHSFLNLFNDPGNPPFHFLLLRIIQYFTNSFIAFRLLSIVFSLLAGIALFVFLKKNHSIKMANIALFLYSINLPLIYFSQEIRCYSLTVFLATLFLIYTFKIVEKSTKKYWIIYGILSVIAVNTHYFQVLFIAVNFLYFVFIFIKEKRQKDLFCIIVIGLITLLSFLPYYLLTAHNQAYLDINFNSTLPEITFDLIKKCVFYIFGGFIPFFLTILFLFKRKEGKEKTLYFYCLWIIFAVIILAIILSLVIRPMVAERYVLFLIPYAIIAISMIFSSEYKNRWIIAFFIVCVFLAQNYSKNSFSHIRMKTSQSHNTFKIANEYKKKTKKDVLLVLKPSDSAIKKLFKFNDLKTRTVAHINSYKISQERIEKIRKENHNSVIFTSHLNFSGNTINLENYTCYFNSTLDLCIWKIE